MVPYPLHSPDLKRWEMRVDKILFGFGASLGLAAVALAAFVGAVILVESVDAEFEHPHGPPANYYAAKEWPVAERKAA